VLKAYKVGERERGRERQRDFITYKKERKRGRIYSMPFV
jgi:hypothetical protein